VHPGRELLAEVGHVQLVEALLGADLGVVTPL
jgi:hypothetical protein